MTLEIEKYAPSEDDEFFTWYEFRDGFELRIKYLTPRKWRRLFARSTSKRRAGWDKGHLPLTAEELDTDKLIENIGGIIVDWNGLTPEILRTIIVLDVKAIKKGMKEEGLKEIPYSENNKGFLLNNARGDFIDFLTSLIRDIDQYHYEARKVQEEELKNSPSSSGGGKRPTA